MATYAQQVDQVEVDQAVFTSSEQGPVQGYQLVARSSGVDERVAHVLRQYSPTHNGLASKDVQASSLNFFPIDKKRFAIGRSVYGLPEYSSRGSLQTVTIYLIVSVDHLRGFDGDAWMLSSIARSMGQLRFDPTITPQLPKLPFQARTILGGKPLDGMPFGMAGMSTENSENKFIDKALELLRRGRDVAIVGEDHPEMILREMIYRSSVEERLGMSFATGLNHTSQRRFRLQFFEATDTDMRYNLSCDDISIVQREKRVQVVNTRQFAWQ